MYKLIKQSLIPMLIIGNLLLSCSPAKRVQKQDTDINALKQQFEEERKQAEAKAVFEWIKNNPCIPPEINFDSLCAAINGVDRNSNFDFSEKSADSPTNKTNPGKPVVTVPGKPQRVIVPYEDTRRINLYLDSISGKETRIKILNQQLSDQSTACDKQAKAFDKKYSEDIWFWRYLFFGLLILEIARIILKHKFKLSWL